MPKCRLLTKAIVQSDASKRLVLACCQTRANLDMVEHRIAVSVFVRRLSPSTRCVFSLSSCPKAETSRAGRARCWARTPAGSHYAVFVRQSEHVAGIGADLRTGMGPDRAPSLFLKLWSEACPPGHSSSPELGEQPQLQHCLGLNLNCFQIAITVF